MSAVSPRRRALPLAIAAVASMLVLGTSCAGPADDETADPTDASTSPTAPETPGSTSPTESSSTAGSESPTEPPEPEGPTLEVTISGDKVGPNAQQISVDVGEPVTITFETDRAGELHVHSKPEQYVEFPAGSSRKELVIKTPGTVEVEEHDSEAVVAVIEVR